MTVKMNTPQEPRGGAPQLAPLLEDEGFWSDLRAAPSCFCGLDYDGTLAPFQVDRMAAVPLDGVIGLLRRLQGSGAARLAVISGRGAQEVASLLGGLELTIVGSHGYEVLTPGQPIRLVPLRPEQRQGLERALGVADQLQLMASIEQKAASLALHTRGQPAGRARRLESQVREAWSAGAEAAGLECREFNGGVELRATGVDKGTALAELLQTQPPGSAMVYLGDDQTDEDAFRVIQERGGTGIRVGAPDHPTAARRRLPDCDAVLRFLELWSERCPR